MLKRSGEPILKMGFTRKRLPKIKIMLKADTVYMFCSDQPEKLSDFFLTCFWSYCEYISRSYIYFALFRNHNQKSFLVSSLCFHDVLLCTRNI